MNIMAELAIIFGICLVSEGISALLPIALPASVISMLVLLALLMAGIVKPRHIDRVCRFLVANMAFFFVAPCAGIIEQMCIRDRRGLCAAAVQGHVGGLGHDLRPAAQKRDHRHCHRHL